MDIASGAPAWSFDVSPDGAGQFHGRPVITDSVIIVGTDAGFRRKGAIYAINRLDGSLLWKSTGHKGVAYDLSLFQDSLIYAVTIDDSLLVISLIDGTLRWAFHLNIEPEADNGRPARSGRVSSVSSPVLVDSLVYFVGRDDTLYCLSAGDGRIVWVSSFDASVTTPLLYAEEHLMLGLDDSSLVTVDPDDGLVIGKNSVSHFPTGGMAYDSGLVHFLDGSGNRQPCKVVGFDLRKRSVRWTQSVQDSDPAAYWFVPRIHIWNDLVVVGSTAGEVVAYNSSDGELAWNVELKGKIRSIGHYETTLYVGTYEGWLYALTLGN